MAAVRIGDNATDAALRLAEIYFARGDDRMAAKLARYQIKHRPYLDSTAYHIAIRSALHLERVDVAIEFAPEPLGNGPSHHMRCAIPGGIRVEFIAKAS